MNIEQAIQEYQCNGCINSSFPHCFKKSTYCSSCTNHAAGTVIYQGPIFLGLPKGFNRLSQPNNQKVNIVKIDIFENEKQFLTEQTLSIIDNIQIPNSLYTKLNVPCWKYLDPFNNTIVKGLSPKINSLFIDIFLFDARNKIHCIEITKDIIDLID